MGADRSRTTTDTPLLLAEQANFTGAVHGFVAGLTERERAAVSASGRPAAFRAGEQLFRQGAPHEGVYLIESGCVRTYYVAPNGREITLAHWTRGAFVGGPELFGGGEHLWSGLATEPTAALLLDGAQLRRLVETIPRLALNLLDGLVDKGRCYSMVLQMLGTRSVIERLAHLLLIMAGAEEAKGPAPGGHALERRLSHAEIATIVGSTRQWVSSALDRFRRGGVIATGEGGRLVVLDPRALRAIAQL